MHLLTVTRTFGEDARILLTGVSALSPYHRIHVCKEVKKTLHVMKELFLMWQ